MFKSFREWIRIPMSEALLIRASGGVLGWYGFRFDLAAIVGVLSPRGLLFEAVRSDKDTPVPTIAMRRTGLSKAI